MTMELGCKGRAETIVTSEKTAKTAGSGALDVFATPFMAALMEEAAWTSIQPYLEDGQGSVGIALNLTHDAATPVGMEVTAEATLTAVDGRRLTFTIEAADEKGPIGSCAHERVLVTAERFLEKAYQKL